MKHISQNEINEDIESAKLYLRSRGILVSTTNDYANHNVIGAKYSNPGIWVHLEERYSDAVALLRNKQHVASSALSQEQMAEIESAVKHSFYSFTENLFGKALSIVLILVLVLAAGYIVWLGAGA